MLIRKLVKCLHFHLLSQVLSTAAHLWQSCGQQCDHGQQGEARIQVDKEAAGLRAVQTLWTHQQHHQPADKSQDGADESLGDRDEGRETVGPPGPRP